jgi:hypothetical protein
VEDLFAELLGILIETVGEFVLQVFFEVAAEALSGLINQLGQSSPAVSAIGLAFALLPDCSPHGCSLIL